MISAPATQSHYSNVRQAIHQISQELREDGAGRSALRRMSHTQRNVPCFWMIMASHLGTLLPLQMGEERESQEQKWAGILASLAEIGPLHQKGRHLSAALVSADVHEDRVQRLLHAHGEQLIDLLRPIASQIQSKSVRVDWSDMALLVLSDGTTYEDSIRQDLARHFYRILHKKNHT